jgi:hypothetical protein
MEEDMKTLCQGVMLALMAVSAVACMDETAPDGVDEQTTGDAFKAEIAPTAAEVALWLDATGEKISVEESGVSITAGCAHIQWCDQPNSPWGTVCIWDACDIITASRECAVDARVVCGGTVPPIDIRR